MAGCVIGSSLKIHDSESKSKHSTSSKVSPMEEHTPPMMYIRLSEKDNKRMCIVIVL